MEKMCKERIGGERVVMEELIPGLSTKEEVKSVMMEKEIGEPSIKEDQTEITREFRDLPPSHFLFKIENFSLLSNANVENYQSSDFYASRYKWRLSLYPNGNKGVNEDKYISLYLVLCNSNELPFQKDVNVSFKLFVYNQIQDKYLAVEDAKDRVRRFRGMKREWGFDQFLSLDVFNDASNGYLVDDCCIFGAEIFVIETDKYEGKCVSVVKEISKTTFTWKFSYSVYQNKEFCESEEFFIGGHKWTLLLYPYGHSTEKGKNLSLYLELKDPETIYTSFDSRELCTCPLGCRELCTCPLGCRELCTHFILRIRNQQCGQHHERRVTRKFSSSSKMGGLQHLIRLNDLMDTSKGFMVDDAVIFEVEIPFMAEIKTFS